MSDATTYRTKELNDFGISCFLIEHLEDPLSLLRNLNANLKRKGVAFVTAALTAAETDHIFEIKSINIITTTIICLCSHEGSSSMKQLLHLLASLILITNSRLQMRFRNHYIWCRHCWMNMSPHTYAVTLQPRVRALS